MPTSRDRLRLPTVEAKSRRKTISRSRKVLPKNPRAKKAPAKTAHRRKALPKKVRRRRARRTNPERLALALIPVLTSIHAFQQLLLHSWPLRCHDRIAHRIARDKIRGHAVRAQNALELRTDTFQCGTGAMVARVRMKADAEHLPNFKGVRQHEQLGFGISSGPDG